VLGVPLEELEPEWICVREDFCPCGGIALGIFCECAVWREVFERGLKMVERLELAIEEFVAEFKDISAHLPDGAPCKATHDLECTAQGEFVQKDEQDAEPQPKAHQLPGVG